MHELIADVVVIGAGPAGLSAACAAKKEGAGKVLIVERDTKPGGILQQCIHAGFGLYYFNEELTGPEYAGRFITEADNLGVDFLLDTMVLEITPDDEVICCSPKLGIATIKAKAIVLAMGCRERTRGGIQIPGSRPAGIFTAGTAQRLINRQNIMIGKNVVILGSGDIGMIMARRLTLEGAKVVTVLEIMDYISGLTRNKVQCLDDFQIPLKLNHTVTRIAGNQRVEGVYVAKVDEKKKPMLETEEFIPCDTLLLSVGLITENELSTAAGIKISPLTKGPLVNQFMQTSRPGIFAAGNVVHVNDLADNVSFESELAGISAFRYAAGLLPTETQQIICKPGNNVRYVCPQTLVVNGSEGKARLFFRVLVPGAATKLQARSNNQTLAQKRVQRISPGEMEFLEVDLQKINGTEITIDAEAVI